MPNRLLRRRGERPRGRASDETNKNASFHLIAPSHTWLSCPLLAG
jgi:hypothetical protein